MQETKACVSARELQRTRRYLSFRSATSEVQLNETVSLRQTLKCADSCSTWNPKRQKSNLIQKDSAANNILPRSNFSELEKSKPAYKNRTCQVDKFKVLSEIERTIKSLAVHNVLVKMCISK
jgi:hypothetical protein